MSGKVYRLTESNNHTDTSAARFLGKSPLLTLFIGFLKMKRQISLLLVCLQLLALLIGTQMPGAWRAEGLQLLHAPSYISSLAHFVLFAGMAVGVAMRPMSWPVLRVLAAALALALSTEAFQFFATERHPRLRDVGIDLAGAVAGLVLIRLGSMFSRSR